MSARAKGSGEDLTATQPPPREQAKGYTVRPGDEWAGRLATILKEIGWSGGQFCAEAARELVEMIESPVPTVPNVVVMARSLRERKATMTAARRPFPGLKPLARPDDRGDAALAAEDPAAYK